MGSRSKGTWHRKADPEIKRDNREAWAPRQKMLILQGWRRFKKRLGRRQRECDPVVKET